MKNLLVLTSIYPGNGLPNTYTWVVHYFAREWVKMGYNVKVIHSCTYFSSLLYKTPTFIQNLVAKHVGFTIPDAPKKNIEHFNIDGVEVYRIPIFKFVPMGSYSKKTLVRHSSLIENILNSDEFVPDIIICHWANPQLYVAGHLKDLFHCTISMVIHERIRHYKLMPNYMDLIKKVDYWGYRSLFNKNEFETSFNMFPSWFRCYSGVPEHFLQDQAIRDFSSANKIMYVGQLLPRKYPDTVIESCIKAYPEKKFSFKIAGDGVMQNKLQNMIKELGVEENVKLLGRLGHDQIIKNLDKSDIFVMISRGEVFGLVYIEAMARKCIVIASKGEGMEGIIENGINGFLCEAGNMNELASILTKIQSLTPEQRKAIAERGYETAKQLSEREVAKRYIETISQKNA